MALTQQEIKNLCSCISLGAGHEAQERTVYAALNNLLSEGKRGVVLADEVGFGKTYEALAIMALLSERARVTRKSFDRVIVLCKPSLLEKWQDELSQTRHDRGFPRYLVGSPWPRTHPVFRLLNKIRVIGRRASATELKSVREDGKLQAPEGIYIVNQNMMTEANRESRFFLKRLYETIWDLVIVDEAHHYTGKTTAASVFAPDGDMTNYDQGLSGGNFGKILALTATPFELTPHEMVQLFGLIRADRQDVERINKGLDIYVRQLDKFFALRQRSEHDPLRCATVKMLKHLRDVDALNSGQNGDGLQVLLRRHIIRNIKSQNERKYFLVNKTGSDYSVATFNKLDDLHQKIKDAPLLPFDGPDALFYLELRELIEETITQAREGTDHRTFITTDLRQGLSSYPQIAKSALLNRDLDSARRLKALVEAWNDKRYLKLHPKVAALADLVEQIALNEIDKINKNPSKWFSKVLVFNKLIGGTAPHLRDVLTRRLISIFDKYLDERLQNMGWGKRQGFARRLSAFIKNDLDEIKKQLNENSSEIFCRVPQEFNHDDFKDHIGHHLVDAYRETLLKKTEQSLFLLHAAINAVSPDDTGLRSWVRTEVTGKFKETIAHIIDYYLDDEPGEERPREELLDMAERECVVLMEECKSIDVVGRYDGENSRYREAHRRNFNGLFNPFVLLVSRVGEEGIDLQQQCRYIIHYDLEWNPAKMEQREGRVDRVGWGRRDEEYIDIRFMLLKGTYEERIFHAVMQRDQWFQVLIGSKRRELGRPDDDETALELGEDNDGVFDVEIDVGRLTKEEMASVMIDLRPS